jgi:hypothetical protein
MKQRSALCFLSGSESSPACEQSRTQFKLTNSRIIDKGLFEVLRDAPDLPLVGVPVGGNPSGTNTGKAPPTAG